MKVTFERHYGDYKIGDTGTFETGKELDYILKTGTAYILEDVDVKVEDFESSEITETKKENKKKRVKTDES